MFSKDIYINKSTLVKWLVFLGFTLAYYGSLYPWFLWPVYRYYQIFAAFIVFLALCISHTMKNPLFNEPGWIPPLLFYVMFQVFAAMVAKSNVNAYVILSFNILLYMSLFRIDRYLLAQLMTFLTKTMAILLIVSILWYMLFLMGFGLPSFDVEFKDGEYYYTNYYFFLLDDRFMNVIIPRFHSVFLEPSYLGTATVMLLMTQYGRWKKWYNIVLIIATLMTFSLEAYILFFILVFLNLWIMNKHVFAKAFLSVFFVVMIVVGSFFYNDGDNLINQLIVLRLEVEDGELAGDNRVGENFQKEFDNLITSSDIIFGRGAFDETQYQEGNSGFKVFLFSYGIFGLLLVLLVHFLSVRNAKNKKMVITAFTIIALDFIARAYPFAFAVFMPFLCLSFGEDYFPVMKKGKSNSVSKD